MGPGPKFLGFACFGACCIQLVILSLLAGSTSLVTIVGNCIVILSFILERSIRQPTNYFIASLAVSDLLIGNILHHCRLNDCSCSHITLLLLLHCLVKCKSRSLAIYNNEFILDSARVGSEMINCIATNTTGNKTSHVSRHIICITAHAQNVRL